MSDPFHPPPQDHLIISTLPSPIVLESSASRSQLDDATPTAVHLYDDDGTSSVAASETVYDPEYHGPNIFPAAAGNDCQVAAALRHFIMQAWFFQLLRERAPDWWLFAMDCILTIHHHILIGRIRLQSLVDANFKVDTRTIVEVVHHVLYYHRRGRNNPAWQPIEGKYIRVSKFIWILENVAEPYLVHVWHAIDRLLYLQLPLQTTPSTFPTFPLVSGLDLHPDDRHYLEYLMTFQPTIGYPLFHHMVPGVMEVVSRGNATTVSPVIGFVLEKFSFVLAWVIIELQELIFDIYWFSHTVLDSRRVQQLMLITVLDSVYSPPGATKQDFWRRNNPTV
ncbi:hypothetical protein BKA83DRAFT_4123845 [Pisolithus microcarpus]|nr:hypothetical protein BKA83DRAFT_4123845 [Pisolithus microcarpus]